MGTRASTLRVPPSRCEVGSAGRPVSDAPPEGDGCVSPRGSKRRRRLRVNAPRARRGSWSSATPHRDAGRSDLGRGERSRAVVDRGPLSAAAEHERRSRSEAVRSTIAVPPRARSGRTRRRPVAAAVRGDHRPFRRSGHRLFAETPGGGGGNRTRVLRSTIRASPSAVRCVSARPHRSHEQVGVTGPVAVWCPARIRDRCVQ